MWYDADLSKKQATEELRGTEGGIAAPPKMCSVCGWYKALVTPRIAENSSFMSLSYCSSISAASPRILQSAEQPSSMGETTRGTQFTPSSVVRAKWGPGDPATGALPPSTRSSQSSCWFGSSDFYRSKTQLASRVFQFSEGMCRVGLLLRTRETRKQLRWADSVSALSKNMLQKRGLILGPSLQERH